jgi:uncharacterized membrane protein
VASKLSKQDREDFEAFCRQATAAQLPNIIQKEKDAGRKAYANIAQRVLDERASK